jgi:hypothetical protein
MKKDYFILMADVIHSREANQIQLMERFKAIVEEANQENKLLLLSPMTITLGDEFQCVTKNAPAALELLFFVEEKIVEENASFKMRYVINEGPIDTDINPEVAYGMLGQGLSKARETLEELKGSNRRHHISLKNKEASAAMIESMFIYQSIIDDWNVARDHDLIKTFVKLKDYKKVAEELEKSRSQIWKREKSLRIEEYFSIKSVIRYIAKNV